MQMNTTTRAAVALLTVLALMLVACGSPAAAPEATSDTTRLDRTGGIVDESPAILTMASIEDHLNRDPQVQLFVDEVAAASGGELVVEMMPRCCGYGADAEVTLVEMVAAGKADLGWTGTRVFDTMGVDSFQPLTAPLLLDSYAVQDAVMASDIPERMLADLDGLGVTGLTVLAGGLRRPMASAAALLGPPDWAGITFHVWWSELAGESIEALGATPVTANRDQGLADGTIRGFENTMTFHALTSGVPLMTPYVTSNVSLWPKTVAIVANPATLAALPASHAEWLSEAATAAALASADAVNVDDDLVVVACDSGSRFAAAGEEDLRGFREAVAPVYDRMRQDPHLAELLADIEALKEATPADHLEVPDRCTGVSPFDVDDNDDGGDDDASAIDGTWEVSFTRDELLDAGILDAGEDNNENWGDTTLVLDRGDLHWTVSNDVLGEETWSGEFEVVDSEFHFSWLGDSLACRWSIFRDALTFERDEAVGVCPTPFIVKPWARSSNDETGR